MSCLVWYLFANAIPDDAGHFITLFIADKKGEMKNEVVSFSCIFISPNSALENTLLSGCVTCISTTVPPVGRQVPGENECLRIVSISVAKSRSRQYA